MQIQAYHQLGDRICGVLTGMSGMPTNSTSNVPGVVSAIAHGTLPCVISCSSSANGCHCLGKPLARWWGAWRRQVSLDQLAHGVATYPTPVVTSRREPVDQLQC